MKNGSPYISLALRFRQFLDEKGFQSPSQFHRELALAMGGASPSLSAIWSAFYGTRPLPLDTVLFMQERYGFKIKWHEARLSRNLRGAEVKANQLSLPGMRDLRR